jgi:hypothetical protein
LTTAGFLPDGCMAVIHPLHHLSLVSRVRGV